MILILAVLIIGVFIGFALVAQREEKDKSSIAGAREAKLEQKEENKKKILELLESRDKITNDDVQKALGVSDATATNYLNELEALGLIFQSGQTGRGVSYTKKRLK